MPSGPGARELIAAFEHVDAQLSEVERVDPVVFDTERRLENLLRKQAATLHVGPANYCWFRDPAKALCLRLAGTTEADQPLIGMCDSARCPQATHHACHRPVWQQQADNVQVLLDNPRVPKGEKNRLALERDRALRVITSIDTTSPNTSQDGSDSGTADV